MVGFGEASGACPRSRWTRATRCSATTTARSRRAPASIGKLARRGRLPVGYYKDPEKTAATFVTIDGERWVIPGDLATIEEDGRITGLRPRLGLHQHRRREGLPRGGRGGAQGAPRRRRRGRRRRARRALGAARRGGRSAAPGRGRHARRRSTRTAARSIAGYKVPRQLARRRRRSCATRAASPTTAGRAEAARAGRT